MKEAIDQFVVGVAGCHEEGSWAEVTGSELIGQMLKPAAVRTSNQWGCGVVIEGYAFKENEKELVEQRNARRGEIQHLLPLLEVKKNPEYGKTSFSGVLKTPETRALSEFDIAILIDSCCFGASCTKSGDRFYGHYWID